MARRHTPQANLSLKDQWPTAKKLFGLLVKKHPIRLIAVFIAVGLAALTQSVGALFTQRLIDDYILPIASGKAFLLPAYHKALLTLALLYALGTLASYLNVRWMVPAAHGVMLELRNKAFQNLQRLPIAYFDQRPAGDIASIFTNDIDTMRQALSNSFVAVVRSILTLATVFLSMLYLNPLLTFLVLATFFIMTTLSQKLAALSAKHYGKQQAALGVANGYVSEMVGGLKTVKTFHYEDHAKENFKEKNAQVLDASRRARRASNILMPITSGIGNLQYVLIAIVGGTLALRGHAGLSIGVIAGFLQLSKNFVRPISELAQEMNAIAMALAGANRVFNLIEAAPEVDEGTVDFEETCDGFFWHTEDGVRIPALGAVSFQNVSFGYTPEQRVLSNLTFDVKPGERVAFVGATGAGKTTIMNLLTRFYDVSEGEILIDGIETRRIKKSALRRATAFVLQDPQLFSTTIGENIRYGKLDADQNAIELAAERASAKSFIERLPEGYDHAVRESGADLSEGQRQLLSIARAEISAAPIFVLDEATSSIDNATERDVERGLSQVMENRTVFLIAHRLSTIREADTIYVLDHGKIIERGNHQSLLAQEGMYHALYTGKIELA